MPQIILAMGDRVINTYVFDKDIISVGRARENDVVIDNLAISRNHARLKREGDIYVVYDLDSANGTYVNDVRVNKKELAHGDVISVGKHKLIFKTEVAEEAAVIGRPDFEKTVVLGVPTAAHLIATRGKWKGSEFPLTKSEVVIGSGKDCDIRLGDWFVSRHHAAISRRGNNFVVRDVGSWRGTKVNGSAVQEAQLKDGDEIQIGGSAFLFRGGGEIAPTRPPAPPWRSPAEQEWLSKEPTTHVVAEKKVEAVAPAEEEPIAAGGWEDYISPAVREPSAIPSEAAAEAKGAVAPVVDFIPEGLDLQAAKGEQLISVTEIAPPPLEQVPSQAGIGEIDRAEPVAVAPVEEQVEPSVAEQGPSAEEIRTWEEALKNKSPVIRKQAAKMLKKLTGKDYDY